MPHTPTTSGRWSSGGARLAVGALAALLVQGCGGGGGGGGTPAPVDHARLDACVLVGPNVSDGCTTSGTDPVIALGDMEMGEAKSRVVALYNGGDGDVSATVSAVAFAPAQAANHTLSLFKLENGVETAATLPFELKPNHATELRVRVQFTANVAVGAVSGVSVAITATHPVTSEALPITANVTGCPAGKGDCDGDPSNACETDTRTTVAHCGGCGAACDATHGTPSCTDGVCGIACDAGYDNCDLGVGNGCETELATDAAHCGTCANACSAANGTPSCTSGSCGIACANGFADCSGGAGDGCETNTQTDLLHCGACGIACGTANGTASCTGGACGIACDTGFSNCDEQNGNGCETVLATDLAHCGACGNACSSTNGTPSCDAGTCTIACNAGFDDCDANVATGCEANLGTDPLHCGACGTACNATNGTATCTAGACGIVCSSGFADCDNDPTNGCEVNLQTDTAHCGGCGTACDATNGTASCTAGLCGITCNDGYGNCDGAATNGCEINLTTDPTHCGACVVACSANNGAPSCTGGLCEIVCAPGFADCDASVIDGCEVNLEADPAHCGACINACNSTNGTATCSAGTCGITCSDGFANCDTSLDNGCEVSVLTDPANCSACGGTCDATNGAPFCDVGACGITCNVGFGDCDALAPGCEADLTSDPANCNGCGSACPTPANATPGCTGGTCGIGACNPGFEDCDGLLDDGCEADTVNDPANCGGCGTACSAPQVAASACTGSACAIVACASGWFDWDGEFRDGCECRPQVGSPACASAPNLGSLNPGQSMSTPLEGIPGTDAYWAVSFPMTGGGYGGGAPTISFAYNNGFAVFDVLTGCGGSGYACSGGGVATDRTTFQFTDNQSAYGYGYYTRNATWPSTVIIRVHQLPGTTTCPVYQLVISR